MVGGLEKFREAFADFSDNFVIIGGTACDEEFRRSMINGAFTSNLDKMIECLPIDYWIYGHSHRNIEAEIHETKMLTNQLGYVFANEHIDFNRKKFIEV